MTYLLSADDTFLDLRGRQPDIPVCPTCKMYFDPFGAPFPGKAKPKKDLCVIVGGLFLASPRFKAFLGEFCTSEVAYLETGGGYFVLRPKRTIFLDLTEMGAHHADRCRACGRAVEVTARVSEPKILGGQAAIGPFDLVRTHQVFGHHNQQGAFLLAGDQLVEAMKAEKMKGPIYIKCLEPWEERPKLHFKSSP